MEKLTPAWDQAGSVLARPFPADEAGKLAAVGPKVAAEKFLNAWCPVLYPEGPDGE